MGQSKEQPKATSASSNLTSNPHLENPKLFPGRARSQQAGKLSESGRVKYWRQPAVPTQPPSISRGALGDWSVQPQRRLAMQWVWSCLTCLAGGMPDSPSIRTCACMRVCAVAHGRSETGTDESVQLQPCSLQCIMGSLSLFAGTGLVGDVLSLSLSFLCLERGGRARSLCVHAHAYTNSRRRLVMATTTVAPATASPPPPHQGLRVCTFCLNNTNEGMKKRGRGGHFCPVHISFECEWKQQSFEEQTGCHVIANCCFSLQR